MNDYYSIHVTYIDDFDHLYTIFIKSYHLYIFILILKKTFIYVFFLSKSNCSTKKCFFGGYEIFEKNFERKNPISF